MPYFDTDESHEYRYPLGSAVRLVCVLDDDDSPSSLPVFSANVWAHIRKESTGKWLNFLTQIFDGDDYSINNYKKLMTPYATGAYETIIDFSLLGEILPDSYLVRYSTDYDFGSDHTDDTEMIYLYKSN